MKVYVFPADEYGCGHYRCIWPARAVDESTNIDVTIVTTTWLSGLGAELDGDGNICKAWYPSDADVIVFQRPSYHRIAEIIPHLRAQGVAVVVDMDDDLARIHPHNQAFLQLHPKNGTGHTWHYAAQACKAATLVTVSTDALAQRYGALWRTRVLHNCVPARFLEVEHYDSPTIGWGGSIHSHPDDLQSVGGAIATLVREGVPFRIVGDGMGVQRALSLDHEPASTGGIVPFHHWATELTRLGIAIAPLADTAFNAAKSWLKPLEAAAVGVPWVGSDRIEYRRLQQLGCGFVVTRPREWERTLRRLTQNRELRSEQSEAGRKVASGLTIEGNAWRWAEAWSDAILAEQKGSRHVVGRI